METRELTPTAVRNNFAGFDRSRKLMNRDTRITVLLVIAGIVLAFVLFGAGVLWKSETIRRARVSFDPHFCGTIGRGEFLKGTDIRHVTSDRKGELL